MYLAYKYAKKRYKEHQAREAEQQKSAGRIGSSGQDRASWDEARGLTASSDGLGVPAPYEPSPIAAQDETEPEQMADDRAEKKRRRTYRLKIILGLFLPFALQALDTTIIASALKFIAEDFRQSSLPP